MKRALCFIVVLAALGGALLYQRFRPNGESSRAKVPVVDEKALAVLRLADEACKRVTFGSYQADFRGEGSAAGRTSAVRGEVQFDAAAERVRARVTVSGKEGVENTFEVATDGEQVVGVDHTKKTYVAGSYPFARGLLAPGLNLLMPKFGQDAPFQAEMGRSPKYEGVQEAQGTACDVVYIARNGEATRWFFGQSDHLPRRVEHLYNLFSGSSVPERTILTLSVHAAPPAYVQGDFQIPVPDGYNENRLAGPEAVLAVGTAAPDWELKSAQGQWVRLSQLRGQVVVLDFWATWCGPCKMAMPKIQELHASYEGQPVKIFGVSCREDRNGDPEGYMKSKNYTYGLLLNGDNVANQYRVSGLPTFYVIDAQGTIAYVEVGFEKEESLKEAVKKALDKTQT